MLFLLISTRESSDVICEKGMCVCVLVSITKRICRIGMIEANEKRLNMAVMRFRNIFAITYHLYGERKRRNRENIIQLIVSSSRLQR